jgi:hypothetical protein
LLVAPVRLASPASPGVDDHVGRAEGVILDDTGHLVAFVLRLSPKLVPGGSARTLVLASAMTIIDESTLVLAWPQDQLLAQRRLDEDLQPQGVNAVAAPLVVPSPSLAATGPAPGEGRVDVNETIKEGAEGSAIGAVVGGILGGIAGGPLLGFALAAFFGVGGGLAGFIAGGGQETHAEPKGETPRPPPSTRGNAALARLEERLRDPMLTTDGLVHMIRFSPMTSAEAPSRAQSFAAHAP